MEEITQHVEEVMGKEAVEQKRRKRQRGFTLVEMLAVVVILAIVGGVGFVLVNDRINTARINTDQANARTIADAVNAYIMDNGAPPVSGNTIRITANDTTLLGKYLGSAPTNPWTKDGDTDDKKYYSVKEDSGTITITSPHDPDTSSTGTGKDPYSLSFKYK